MASTPELVVEVRAIGHCAECRYWGDIEENGTRRCALVTRIAGHPEITGSFWTYPDFGCVRWEAKDDG